MIDPNSIAQADQVAQVVRVEVTNWWPTICAVAVLVSREICKANGWLEYVAGKIIAHGGIWQIVTKLWNNPGPK